MIEPQPARARRSLTDSPWFWGYLFLAGALIALALTTPKYSSRQTQLERRFLARQEGGQTVKGVGGQTIETPSEDNLILSLAPLFVICGLLLVIAWSRLWWTRLRPRTQDACRDGETSNENQRSTDSV